MVLDLLLIALAITVDPLPIMAFVLVVSSARGVWKGLAFILAWLACLVAVIAIVLTVTDGQPPPPRSSPGIAGVAAKLVIGLGLVFYGLHRRRLMKADTAPTGSTTPLGPDVPGGSSESAASRVDSSSVWAAAGLAVLVQPWGLVAAGATTVLEANTSHASTYLALFGFCFLATASLLAAELYIVFAPEVAHDRLMRLRGWLEGHTQQAIVVICLVLGLWLTGKSIYQLTG
ncbi:GAP family protein [Streptomyces sp. NPDC058290]|uniref:GAP family protein n=1 Tax=Streptomyces sp. NPDC058290 TaxID=3346426 RepID=UPI0036EA7358